MTKPLTREEVQKELKMQAQPIGFHGAGEQWCYLEGRSLVQIA